MTPDPDSTADGSIQDAIEDHIEDEVADAMQSAVATYLQTHLDAAVDDALARAATLPVDTRITPDSNSLIPFVSPNGNAPASSLPISSAVSGALDDLDDKINSLGAVAVGNPADGRSELGGILLDAGIQTLLLMENGGDPYEIDHASGRDANEESVSISPVGTVSPAWGPARKFTRGTQNGRWIVPTFDWASEGFSLNVGITFRGGNTTNSFIGAGGNAIMGDTEVTNSFYMYRNSANHIVFAMTRSNGSGNSTVTSSEVVAIDDTEVHLCGWFDPKLNELGLSVNGVITRLTAQYGVYPAQPDTKVMIGAAPVSGAINNNYHTGDIGYAALCRGPVGGNKDLTRFLAADWENAKQDLNKPHYNGDSLTESNFVNVPDRWPTIVSTDQKNQAYINAGTGGDTSSTIRTKLLSSKSKEIRGQVLTVWAGNNDGITNPTLQQQVINNLQDIVNFCLFHGAKIVLVFTCPNRTNYTATDTAIDYRTSTLAIINAGFADIVANSHTEAQPVLLVDMANAWTPALYPPKAPYETEDASDMARGITPRSSRDDPTSNTSTHFGVDGDAHNAATINKVLDDFWATRYPAP